jgi:hypothetical protein
MENYLVDLLNEVATRSLTPFKQQDKIVSLSQAQLLSFENADALRGYLLQAENRSLSGKGFRDFEKYYKKRFNIAFSQGPVSVDAVDGIYARRHLLVHAGGVIDRQFQKRYAPNEHPGQLLEISEEYFLGALSQLEALSEYCALRIEVLFPKNVEPVPPPVTHLAEEFQARIAELAQNICAEATLLITWFEAQFRTPELLEAHFSETATFNISDTPHKLADILAGVKRVGQRKMQWIICGDKAVVGPYIAYLEYLSRRGMLEEFDKQSVSKKSIRLSTQ